MGKEKSNPNDTPKRSVGTRVRKRYAGEHQPKPKRKMRPRVLEFTDDVGTQEVHQERDLEVNPQVGEGSESVVASASAAPVYTATTGLPPLEDYGGPEDLSLLCNFKHHVAYAVRTGVERGSLTCRHHHQTFVQWSFENETDFVKDKVRQSGLYPLVEHFPRYVNNQLISAFVERWHPETSTFHFPFGEMTITLDDVKHITGLPVVGKPVTGDMGGSSIAYEDAKKLLTDAFGVSETVASNEMAKNKCYAVRLDWVKDLFKVKKENPTDDELKQRARGYLFFLLGSTLFSDKSGNRVPIYFLQCLMELEKVSEYAWGSTCLCNLYRQLGQASRWMTKQMAGHLPLLEVWIHEHFRLCGKLRSDFKKGAPRVSRYLSQVCAGDGLAGVIAYREHLDDLSAQEVIWNPYSQIRDEYPLQDVAWYTGCLVFFDMAEPHNPERVLRQYGQVQRIPRPPMQTKVDQRQTSRYKVQYKILESYLQQWEDHVLSERYRSKCAVNQWECTMDYMDWFLTVTHPYVQDPTKRGSGALRSHGPYFSAMNRAVFHAVKLLKASFKSVERTESKIKQAHDMLRLTLGPHTDAVDEQKNDDDADEVDGSDGGGAKSGEDSR